MPLYLAMLALSAWSAGALLRQADVAALEALFSLRTPVRGIAVYMWATVALNAATWLARIVPAIIRGGAPGTCAAPGWRPTSCTSRIWRCGCRCWRWRPPGCGSAVPAVTCWPAQGWLALWVLESVSIAVDQWYGRAADPASPVASGALVPAFAALAVIGLIPAGLLLHGLSGGTTALRPPAAARRGWPSWSLAVLDGLTGAAAVYGGVELIRDGFGMPDNWLAGTR